MMSARVTGGRDRNMGAVYMARVAVRFNVGEGLGVRPPGHWVGAASSPRTLRINYAAALKVDSRKRISGGAVLCATLKRNHWPHLPEGENSAPLARRMDCSRASRTNLS